MPILGQRHEGALPVGVHAMLRIVHPVAGLIALVTIATFWISTTLSEAFGTEATVVAVKTTIPWGFIVLIPALAATGGSGFTLSRGQRTGAVKAKLNRMPFIAANGVLVLIPSALFLASRARVSEFDAMFYAVQGIELVAGAVNIALLSLSTRDGMALTAWRRKSFLRPASAYSTTVRSIEHVATDTISVHLAKPVGFEFRAGQAVYVTLPTSPTPDAKGNVRTFSIASAPGDPDLVLATRRTESSFKRALAALSPGSTVDIEGPYGDLVLHRDSAVPAVLLAGGVGITPFRSMVMDAIARNLPHQLILFYSNRRPEDAAFLSELRELARRHPQFRMVTTITEPEKPGVAWNGERGVVTGEMLAKHIVDLKNAVYYVAGPPSMVQAMQKLLDEAGVSSRNVRAERFAGY